jgi:hypothetical protein
VATLRGAHFAQGLQVTIGGAPATIQSITSPTELTCRIPFTDAGRLDVKIEQLGMSASLPAAFQHDGQGGPSDDADADGLPTLIEQFMGLDPAVSDARGAFDVQQQQGTLILYYRRARDTGGASGWVEWSDTLLTWSTSGVSEVIARDVPGEPFQIVAALLPGNPAARYARLRVRQ